MWWVRRRRRLIRLKDRDQLRHVEVEHPRPFPGYKRHLRPRHSFIGIHNQGPLSVPVRQ